MNGFIQALITASIILGIVCSANALPYGFGCAKVNLNAFDYGSNVSVYADHPNLYSTAYALALDQDGKWGSTTAGSGALLSIFQDGGIMNHRFQWLDVAGDGGSQHDSLRGTLETTLSGQEAGTTFGAFVHTAAYAATSTGAAPAPEPATMILLGSGLIGLAGLGRKKFRK